MGRSQAAAVPLMYRAAYSASATEPQTVGIPAESIVDSFIMHISEIMPTASDGVGAWARVIGYIGMNIEDHLAAGVAGAMIRM